MPVHSVCTTVNCATVEWPHFWLPVGHAKLTCCSGQPGRSSRSGQGPIQHVQRWQRVFVLPVTETLFQAGWCSRAVLS